MKTYFIRHNSMIEDKNPQRTSIAQLGEFGLIDHLTKNFEIIQPSKTVVMTDKKEMYDYFRKRRRGLFKQEVLIKIK